jgi:two-component system, OmpR family, sensor kinase
MHPGHHRHHPGRRRHWQGSSVGAFMRAKLRRKLFAWFATGIVLTAILVAGAMSLLGQGGEPAWARRWERTTAWVGQRFAASWEDPPAREAFAREAALALEASLVLIDRDGRTLLEVGTCSPHGALRFPVTRGGVSLGEVRACYPPPPGLPFKLPLALALTVLSLWGVSGVVARRVVRPLDELVEVVKRIGDGDLSARTDPRCRSADELGVVSEAVNDMAARIEKQLKDQQELLATVSHELRTPLSRIRLISELARDGGATPRTFDDLDREVTEMDALVGELLASSRVAFGVLNLRPLDVRDVVGRAAERAGLRPEQVVYQGIAGPVQADATLLSRALLNLIDNAVKHGGGVEALRVSLVDGRVHFEVQDRGPGLVGDVQTLFQKFQREGDGLGLGLNLVKRIAEAHHGTVWARNREGGGAEVGFAVPA